MTRKQRAKYEMFVRVRDFGAARTQMFPESTRIGQSFARVADAVAAIEEHRKNYVVATSEARRVKAATRTAVFDYMKTIALIARRVTIPEVGENPFRVPRRRNLEVELATARAFLEEAEKRQAEFVEFGLPPTFISEFRALVDKLQEAMDVRLSSKTGRGEASAGVRHVLTAGLVVIHDLDALITVATRDDPTTFAAWTAARRIEGQRPTTDTAKTAAATVAASPPEPAAVAPPATAGAAASSDAPAPVAASGEPAPAPSVQQLLERAS